MKRNLIFLFVTFASSFVGVCLPNAAAHLQYVPALSIVIQLLYCFLSMLAPDTPLPMGSLRALPAFLLFKMFAVPIICWGVTRLLFPEYALGALLVAGASVGVMGPFFAYLSGAEPFFVVGSVIASSLILPVSIPLLAAAVLSIDGRSVDGLMQVCAGAAVFLACSMFAPFVTTKLLWARAPKAAEWLLNRRFIITLCCVGAANFTIFSRYSARLLSDLPAMGEAMVVALLITVIMLAIGLLAGRGKSADAALSRIIGISCVNCGLMVVVSAEFFSLAEVLVCALHTLPLMSMGVPYELCRRWLTSRSAVQAG